MLNNCFSPRVKLSPSVTLMWRLQVEVYLHLVICENGRCGLLIWHMISIMFTFVWTIGWHLSAGIVAMGGMDNSSSCNHGYHRQVSSSCFTWSVLCPSMAKCSAGGIFQWRNLFQLLLALWSCIYQALQVTLLSLPFLRFPFLSPYFPFLFSSPLSPSSSVLLRPPPPLTSSPPPPLPSSLPSSLFFSPSLPPLPSPIGYRHAAIFRQGWQWRRGWNWYGLQGCCWPHPHSHCCNYRWRKTWCHRAWVSGAKCFILSNSDNFSQAEQVCCKSGC